MPDPSPMAPPTPAPSFAARWPWLLGTLAGLAVLLTIGDPGITSDEPIDVKVGRNYLSLAGSLIDQVGSRGLGSVRQANLDAFFADNAQHPPLGRWLVGLASVVFEPIEGLLGGADPMSVHPARVAPMLAFAVLVGLITREAGRRFGPPAGIVAGVSLVLMPRVFAHAHFATLDTILALCWTLALLAAARAIEGTRPVLALAIAGAFWGLALLTKIHAWLLPPLVLGYALLRLPIRKAIPGAILWGLVGLLVFLVGWPWLWNDSADRLVRFLSTSVDRQPIRVLYFGRVVEDVALPWHYPWVYFALTVPVGLHLLGLLGLIRGLRQPRTDPFPALLASSILLFLVLFSTRAPVYDGERLFLLTFPSWAILIGLGFQGLWDRFGERRWLRGLLIALVVSQGGGVVRMHPYQLSYYNLLIGGLPGAERLGMELTYWGDTLAPPLLAEVQHLVPQGEAVAIAPTFHHLYPTALLNAGLFEKEIRLLPEQGLDESRWLLVFRRSAYWSPAIEDALTRGEPVLEQSRAGVWLSRLYRFDAPDPAFVPDNREDSFRTN
ncbi:glycosyltransferase family 39 protein [Tautonia marina]|uniref:glycosyltransferase family 39 protein n=1 Tax=Tautonia marina TaxID=2653855 RepID=UPI001260EE57|nr:glycosyltransferase family 39 protein [Tautonia marina]